MGEDYNAKIGVEMATCSLCDTISTSTRIIQFHSRISEILAHESGSNECASTTNNLEGLKDASLYVSDFIACLAEFPVFLVATFLVDRIGRKLTMEILTIFGLILILPLSSHQNQIVTMALIFSARMFLFTAFSTLTICAKEVYPTCIRASGSGLATSMGRIGGKICPLVAVGLVRGCHQTAAVVISEL
ncbi:organic cation/carnitine transporter 7-like [Primulina tabacum]|uniref:organic cation/carnitine transporter 7-like n=1 Tax=Primulina tabacum TaxID=48773 RepID=UPI003F59DD0F